MGLTDRALAQQGEALHAKLTRRRDPVTGVTRISPDSQGLDGSLDLPGIYNDLAMYEGVLRTEKARPTPERDDLDGRPVRLLDPVEAQRAEMARFEAARMGGFRHVFRFGTSEYADGRDDK